MKYQLLFCFLALLIYSCGPDPAKTMKVTGTVKGLKKGTIYLQHIQDSNLVALDSVRIQGKGEFEFETPVESPEIFYLYLDKNDHNEINDRITFFGEAGTIDVQTEWNAFDTKARITGSASQEKLEEYKKVMSGINKKNLEIMRAAYDPEIQQDSVAMDSIGKLSDKNIVRGYVYALNFALNNTDSYVAPYIALTEVSNANIKYLDSIYHSLTPEVAESHYGQELGKLLERRKKESQ